MDGGPIRQPDGVIYDAAVPGPDALPREPDNVTVDERSGDLDVAGNADDIRR